MDYFDPTCKECGDPLTTEELICLNCRTDTERQRCLKAVDNEPEWRFGFHDKSVAFAKANIRKRIEEGL